jgi:gliding motility-associated-like protein
MKKVFCILIVFYLFIARAVLADHIVGGELRIRPSGTVNGFEITLLQFWDENKLIIPTKTIPGNRDATATLYIYQKGTNQFMDSLMVTYQSSQSVTYQNKSCAVARSMKTLQGVYMGSITLSPQKYSDDAGYYVVWERCCRNGDINNIKQPGTTGMVFYLEFPPLRVVDSSPEFQFPNGQYICVNRPFSMNMSATDADGDELRYSLVTPMGGNTGVTPGMSVGNAKPKSSYPLVTWETGISVINTIPGPSPLAIDWVSGTLTVTAGQIGLYVFAIQCEEFRNGKRIGVVRRDFQLLVIDCGTEKPDPPIVTVGSQPVKEVKFCPEKPVKLETVESSQWSYQWQLNGLNIAGATSASIMVSDTGRYSVVKSYNAKCTSDTTSIPILVFYADPIVAIITPSKEVLCVGDSATLTANSGVAKKMDETYIWRKDRAEIVKDKVQITIGNTGLYGLEISNTLGCVGHDSILISRDSIKVKVPEKVNLLKGRAVSVKAVTIPAQNGNEYLWNPIDKGFKSDPTDSIAILGPTEDSRYTIRVTTVNGCVAMDTVSVVVFENLHIPTAFSPDRNGINDTFEIFNDKEQILDVRIFNRWGNVIFQSAGYPVPWNGSYKNETVPAGVYPYIIKTSFGEYRGEVMVLR